MPVTTTARLRYVSIPPRKMRLVARMVKGLPIQRALDVLNFTPRIAAGHIAKTLKSAAANVLSQEGTAHVRPEDLHVKNIVVDEAPTAKRIRFQSMGRVFRYRRRYSHLTVVLEERANQSVVEEPPTKGRKKTAPAAAPAAGTKKRATAKRATAKRATAKRPARKVATKKTATKKAAESNE